MILRLNTTEMMDWQEVWCFRCEHDHGYSHVPDADPPGCSLLVGYALGDDVPEWVPHDEDSLSFLPAEVSCSKFTPCGSCPPDPPDAERRGPLDETRREFHDRLRAETLARPVFVDVTTRQVW